MSTNINSTEQIVEINAGDQITNVNIVSQSTTQVISGEQVVTVDVNAGTIPAAWGSITGTLSNQTDLQNALNAKQNNITLTTTGTTGVATLVGATLNIPNYVSSTKQSEWDSAYNDKINSAEVSGTTTKTLTLTQQDGGIIQASWSDFDTAPVTSVFGRTGDVVAAEGDYNINQLGDVTITSATNGQVLKYNGTAWVNAADASGLTSVGLAMPSAFTVSGSPLTSNGTITVTGAGTTSQYVRGDGSLAAFPSVSNEAKTLIREVYNKTGATLTKGTVIYIDGGQGNLPTVTKAIATGDPTSAQTFGIVQSDITDMNNGFVVVAGGIDNLDTQTYTEGTALYLSPTTAGAWTSTKPYAPDHMVYLGVVVRSHPTQGVIEVKIQNGVELDEIHDVSARFPTNKDGIFYNSTSGVWENKSIAGVLGYTPVPESRIITINGTAQDLSADRTYNVGTVTSIAASGGTGISVAGSPVTGSGTITITNTAPDQVVGLTGAGTTSISGTYPNFTITSNDQYTGTVTSVAASGGIGISISGSPITSSGTINITNTAPDQIVSLTGAGTTSISGTYPNFTVTSNDQYVGTVTSVNATVPTGFEVSGVPITSSGTVDIKFASGYSLPTTAKQGQWDDAYAKRIDSLTVTGNSGSASLTSNILNVPTYTLTGLGGEPAITAGTTLQYFRGDKTFQTLNTSVVPESGNVYFTEPRVRATVLSGLNITGGSISASDSVLNAFGKVQNQINGLIGGSIFQSTWNASTNTPTLASGVGTKGYYYIVSVAGTTNLDGITDWQIGDWAIFDGTVWRKVDNTDAVVSVNGYTGVVNLVLDDLADVSAASPTDTQLLRYNGTTSKWYNWTPTFLNSLNGITNATQTFATGTSGTDFNISSTGSTHTFNIPSASAANRGLVTTGAQTFAGDKTFNSSVTVGTDLILTGGNPRIDFPNNNTLRLYQTSVGTRFQINIDGTIQLPAYTNNGFVKTDNSNGTLTIDTTTYQPLLTNPITGDGTESAGNIAYFSGNTSIVGSSSLFWDSANERLGIKYNTPQAHLHIHSALADVPAEMILSNSGQSVSIGDLGILWFGSAEGSGWKTASIKGIPEQDFNADDCPTSLIFSTTPDLSSTPAERLRISSKGTHTITGISDENLILLQQETGGTKAAISITENVGLKINSYEGSGARTIDFLTNGTSSLFINNDRNIGIGVTPSSWSSPDYRALQIGSGLTVFGRSTTDEDRGGIVTNGYNDGTAWKYIAAQSAAQYYQADGTHYFYSAGVGTVNGNITWNTLLTLENSNALTFNGTGYFNSTLSAKGLVSYDWGTATTPVSSAGWYKIAQINSRGGAKLTLSFTGGDFQPTTYVAYYYKDWSNEGTLHLEQYGVAAYITAARIRLDQSDSIYYLEIYCASNANGLEFRVYHDKTLGYNATSIIYTGALSSGSATGTTIVESEFTEGITTYNLYANNAGVFKGDIVSNENIKSYRRFSLYFNDIQTLAAELYEDSASSNGGTLTLYGKASGTVDTVISAAPTKLNYINNDANVMIGWSTDQSYKFAVNGTVYFNSTVNAGGDLQLTGANPRIDYPSGSSLRLYQTGVGTKFQISSTGDAEFAGNVTLANGSDLVITPATSGVNATLYNDIGKLVSTASLVVQGTGEFSGAISGTNGTFTGDLTVDTNTLYVDSTNNRVGIGTINPTANGLMIERTGNHLYLRASTATAGKYWNFDVTSANQLYIQNNAGTQYLTITDGGNFGLNEANPSANIHIKTASCDA